MAGNSLTRRAGVAAAVGTGLACCVMASLPAWAALAEGGAVVIRRFLSDQPLCRAGRPAGLTAVVVNDGATDADVTASLAMPPGVRLVTPLPPAPIRITTADGEQHLRFEVEADAAGPAEIVLELSTEGAPLVRQRRREDHTEEISVLHLS